LRDAEPSQREIEEIAQEIQHIEPKVFQEIDRVGVQAELTEQAGLPRLEIEEIAGGVLVRFCPSRYIAPRQVRQDLTEWAVKNDLAALKTLSLVRSIGRGRGARWLIENAQ